MGNQQPLSVPLVLSHTTIDKQWLATYKPRPDPIPTILKEKMLAQKQFRYCPRLTKWSRDQWTEVGYNSGLCIPVVGTLEIPKGAKIFAGDDDEIRVNSGTLIPGSLTQVEQVGVEKLSFPLNDENGIVSSLFDKTFIYPQGTVVFPNHFSEDWCNSYGLHAFTTKKSAEIMKFNRVNRLPGEMWYTTQSNEFSE